jgi:hypothetical protein
MECRNKLSGVVTSRTEERTWSLPGLEVSFQPLTEDCKHGGVHVEMAWHHRAKDAGERTHDESQPKM